MHVYVEQAGRYRDTDGHRWREVSASAMTVLSACPATVTLGIELG